jgi:hypothetical protein
MAATGVVRQTPSTWAMVRSRPSTALAGCPCLLFTDGQGHPVRWVRDE